MPTAIVTAYPRIHIGLVDLGHATARKYGGAGFMLDIPAVRVSATLQDRQHIDGLEHLSERDRGDVTRVVQDACTRYNLPPLQVRIEPLLHAHVGLGSKTSLLMATVACMTAASEVQIDRLELQKISRRGGVSGVGIHGFFLGGFLVDSGHPQDFSAHQPSGSIQSNNVPLLMIHTHVHPSWMFYLILPSNGNRLSGKKEAEFFGCSTPISRSDVLEALSTLYHGLVPAVMTGDLRRFRTCLTDFHGMAFKRSELLNQPPKVRHLLRELCEIPHIAAGLSSIGPLIYAVSDHPRTSVAAEISEICQAYDARMVGTCCARNRGYDVWVE